MQLLDGFTSGYVQLSRIEHSDIDRTQVDAPRRYVEGLGGTHSLAVQVGDQTFQIGVTAHHPGLAARDRRMTS